MLFISYANESSRLEENLPARSQFYSNRRVHFCTYRYCQSATFGPLAFCVCSLFCTILNKKRISNHHISCDVYIRSECGSCPDVATATHDLEYSSTTMVGFIVLSITFVFMVLGVSYSRVLAQYT